MFKKGSGKKNLVGLDIGSSSIKAVELGKKGAALQLLNLGFENLQTDTIVDGQIMELNNVSNVISQIFNQQQELENRLAAVNREFEAIDAYEAAKTGKAVRSARQSRGARTQTARRGSKREALLEMIRGNPDGLKRGDILERMGLKGDKQGLGLTHRNKKRFPAQHMVLLLSALAHNVLLWARHWLAAQCPVLRRFGLLRLVRDVCHVSGRVRRDAQGRLVQIILNQAAPLARSLVEALRVLLAPLHVAVSLGET